MPLFIPAFEELPAAEKPPKVLEAPCHGSVTEVSAPSKAMNSRVSGIEEDALPKLLGTRTKVVLITAVTPVGDGVPSSEGVGIGMLSVPVGGGAMLVPSDRIPVGCGVSTEE